MDRLEPIVHERRLRCLPAEAFDAWLRMGQWWPADYSENPETLEDVIVGREVGAPMLMRHRDIGDVEWGRVTGWEPGVRLEHGGWHAGNAGLEGDDTVEGGGHT